MIDTLIRQKLSGFKANRILDVGPGFSSFSRTSASVTGAREITFVDFDTNVLRWQLGESEKAGLKASGVTLRLDTTGLQGLEGPFDLIHCQEVLEHLPNAGDVLIALRQKLAPSGRMIVTVPSRCSERWLKTINRGYMRDEPFGHVHEFNRNGLKNVLKEAGLKPIALVPTQPHYFIAHTWFYGSRMKSEPSTGKILTGGIRGAVFSLVFKTSRWLFMSTGSSFWGALFPRNYFVVAVPL
jgi:SAM-dependent methyltransferase